MPAQRLTNKPVTVSLFDVTAKCGTEPDLMIHALLCNEPSTRHDVTAFTELRHFHMGPPLGTDRDTIDAVGAAGLSAAQCRQIKTFVDDRKLEKEAEQKRLRLLGQKASVLTQYCVLPEATGPTSDYPLWRFSCVGFVLQAYQTARIKLLDGPYPERSLDDLKRFYPALSDHLDSPSLRVSIGLDGQESWPIALVGYVLHSLARTQNEINGPRSTPYNPIVADSHYPHAQT